MRIVLARSKPRAREKQNLCAVKEKVFEKSMRFIHQFSTSSFAQLRRFARNIYTNESALT